MPFRDGGKTADTWDPRLLICGEMGHIPESGVRERKTPRRRHSVTRSARSAVRGSWLRALRPFLGRRSGAAVRD
jgi:hypothetical protein